jgi:hypothetical protein
MFALRCVPVFRQPFAHSSLQSGLGGRLGDTAGGLPQPPML